MKRQPRLVFTALVPLTKPDGSYMVNAGDLAHDIAELLRKRYGIDDMYLSLAQEDAILDGAKVIVEGLGKP